MYLTGPSKSVVLEKFHCLSSKQVHLDCQGAKKNNTLVSGNAGGEIIFTRAAAKKKIINLIEFFKQSLHFKTTRPNSTFFVEKQRALSFIV